MGQYTRTEIVSAGLQQAGNTALTTMANGWLNRWLLGQYDAWPWPFLMRKASVVLPAGTQELAVGGGAGGLVPLIKELLGSQVHVFDTGRAIIKRIPLMSFYDEDSLVQAGLPASVSQGIPERIVAVPGDATGQYKLYPAPFPDRALNIAFSYKTQPARLDETGAGDASKPLYPNDQTMVHAVYAFAMRHLKRPEAEGALAELAGRAANDRVAHSGTDGINSSLGLDPRVFR